MADCINNHARRTPFYQHNDLGLGVAKNKDTLEEEESMLGIIIIGYSALFTTAAFCIWQGTAHEESWPWQVRVAYYLVAIIIGFWLQILGV